MKPTPLTDEQISEAIENCSSDTKPDFLVEFARAIEAAVNAKWQEMLKQEPVAWMAKNKNGGTESLIRASLLERIGRNDDHDYFPLFYAAPQPAQQEPYTRKRCVKCGGELMSDFTNTCYACDHPQPAQQEFNPDWSMLEATQESLREHMAMLKVRDELLRQALEALEYHTKQTRPIHQSMEVMVKLKEALHEQSN